MNKIYAMIRLNLARLLMLFMLFYSAQLVRAQTPAVGGVTSAASSSPALTPGGQANIFGSNFGTSTTIAVTADGKPAYVVYATQGQLIIQIPPDATPGNVSIRVGNSAAFNVTLVKYAPTFSALLPPDHGGSYVTVANPAVPGEAILFAMTGLGPTNPTAPAGSNPPYPTSTTPSVTVGGLSAQVDYSLLMTGFLGLYAVKIRIPLGIQSGSASVVVSIGGSTSPALSLPIGAALGPVISSVQSGAGAGVALTPGAPAFIYGSNFGTITTIAVVVDGKPAVVSSATPTQLLIQIPPDAAPGNTSVRVGNSAPFNITLAKYAPAFFTQVVPSRNNGGSVTAANPALPGEVISFTMTGLGPTNPTPPVSPTITSPSVTVGGVPAQVVFSGLSPGAPGYYTLLIRIPPGPQPGLVPVVVSIGGSTSPALSLPIGAAVGPVIVSVQSGAGGSDAIQANIQAGTWVSIFGVNLAGSSRDWTGAFNGDALPTSLAGVSVSINGKTAYPSFVSPTQINVQAPSDLAVGLVPVIVTNNGQASPTFSANLQTHAPAFFHYSGDASRFALVTRYPDNAYVADPSVLAGTVAAKPGDVLILWGTGFGATVPPTAAGTIPAVSANTASPVTVTVGSISVNVIGAALSQGLVAIYQIAIQLPANLPAGTHEIRALVGGVQSPTGARILVANNP